MEDIKCHSIIYLNFLGRCKFALGILHNTEDNFGKQTQWKMKKSVNKQCLLDTHPPHNNDNIISTWYCLLTYISLWVSIFFDYDLENKVKVTKI